MRLSAVAGLARGPRARASWLSPRRLPPRRRLPRPAATAAPRRTRRRDPRLDLADL